jgi:diaminopimelate epimerase
MKHYFFKYQGAGNDFILLDDRQLSFPDQDKALIKKLCDRRFGIGSDGIILIKKSDTADVWIDFLNPDGTRSFCGNGSRCGVRFAKLLGMISADYCTFQAVDGNHEAWLTEKNVRISMNDVAGIEEHAEGQFLFTGSPHLIIKKESGLDSLDVKKEGAAIRYNEQYKKEGVNVNYVHAVKDDLINIRTYERGVEDETLACGTGVTAAALAHAFDKKMSEGKISVSALGGLLSVSFMRAGQGFKYVELEGPAEEVFCGEMNLYD